jgi:hypothetical protein
MSFKNILIVGCSFANGSGLPGEHSNPSIWPNQLGEKFNIAEIKNAASTGANNYWIFLETISQLLKNSYDLVLVEWSAIPRYKFKVGLELYPTDSMLDRSINLVSNETVSAESLDNVKKLLHRLHNDHWDILELVKYINALIEIQITSRQKKLFFINGIGPWSDQYFVKKQITLPSDLDQYTRNLLQADQRDDQEVFQLYNMIHNDYVTYGGIHENLWLNLYSSMNSMKIDTVSTTDRHPGYMSQDIFAEYFYQTITKKLNETSNNCT